MNDQQTNQRDIDATQVLENVAFKEALTGLKQAVVDSFVTQGADVTAVSRSVKAATKPHVRAR